MSFRFSRSQGCQHSWCPVILRMDPERELSPRVPGVPSLGPTCPLERPLGSWGPSVCGDNFADGPETSIWSWAEITPSSLCLLLPERPPQSPDVVSPGPGWSEAWLPGGTGSQGLGLTPPPPWRQAAGLLAAPQALREAGQPRAPPPQPPSPPPPEHLCSWERGSQPHPPHRPVLPGCSGSLGSSLLQEPEPGHLSCEFTPGSGASPPRTCPHRLPIPCSSWRPDVLSRASLDL